MLGNDLRPYTQRVPFYHLPQSILLLYLLLTFLCNFYGIRGQVFDRCIIFSSLEILCAWDVTITVPSVGDDAADCLAFPTLIHSISLQGTDGDAHSFHVDDYVRNSRRGLHKIC